MAATHIGNPIDIPVRTLDAARTADLLVFEEDRPARLVLKSAGVHREYLRYSEHKQAETIEAIEEAFRAGKSVLFMSDQGCPSVADPGGAVVDVADRCGARVEVIPGPSSITAALSACPFAGREYFFVGFLPRENEDRFKRLKQLQAMHVPLVMMDTPYRMKHLVAACEKVFGAKHRGLLAIDISGPAEAFHLGTLKMLLKAAEQVTEKLNFVLVLDK
jgi:16S rRNA (cytidine1402-2'-O)-methyltransferase